MTILPRSAAPRFAAIVSDTRQGEGRTAGGEPFEGPVRYPGSHIRLIWTGQRKITGINPGVELAFEGMLSIVDGVPTIYNPRYEIIGRPEETP